MDDDGLSPDELVLTGGSWSGLLFGNPSVGYETALTWSFTFEYDDLERDFGETSPTVTVEWVTSPAGTSWQTMGGLEVASRFGQPVEAGVYFFDHYSFETIGLAVLEQQATRLLVRATLAGDLDGLGIASLTAEGWLDFAGIHVQPPERPASVAEAAARLAELTSLDGLTGQDAGHNYLFGVTTAPGG